MKIFAIGDLHLGFFTNKKMDIFGENWHMHEDKIKRNWESTVAHDDTVLVCGDFSWARNILEVEPDMEFLQSLPGKKILIPGNHDYWWASVSFMNMRFGEGGRVHFLKNNFYPCGDFAICGARGWTCPNDTFFTQADEKIYNRELQRLRLSLTAAISAGHKKIILMLHFPPVNDKYEQSGFMKIIQEYPVQTVAYGHLHGADSFNKVLNASKTRLIDSVKYRLVSADYLDFQPLLLT